MARQILPIVGAVVGGVVGGPAGAQVGFALGSLIGNAVDPIEMQGNRLGDSPVQTASEGGARAVVFGTGCIRATVVLERGGRRVIKDRQSGGKGGPVTVNERALWTFAIGLGEAIPGGALLRIWMDEKLVYDARDDSAIPEDTIEFGKKFRFYDGSEDQLPDPALEALHGVGEAPYYRGTAYLVFPNFDLTDTGERVPTFRVEVAASATFGQANAVMAYGYMQDFSLQPRIAYSPDGMDWSSPVLPEDGTGGPYLGATGERFLSWGVNVASYSDDRGQTWTQSAGSLGGSGGIRSGAIDGNRVYIAGGVSQIRRSVDGGATFEGWAGSPWANHIAIGDTYIGAFYGAAGQVYRYGSTWEGPFETGISPLNTNKALVSDGALYRAAGEIDGVPAIKRSFNLATWESDQLPTNIGDRITVLAQGRVGGNTIWLAGTNTGTILRAVNAGPFSATADFGYAVSDIVFNGAAFLIAGGDEVGPTTGQISISTDGTTLVPLPNNFGQWVRSLAAVPESPPTATGQPVPLSSVLAWIHQRAGHTSADYDVSEATDMLAGVVLEQTVTGAEAINSIIGAYFLDPSDYDGKIHYIRRGKPVVKTLTEDDLIDEPESAQRNNAIEYPRKVHFFFGSSANAYAVTKATSARYSADVKVVGEVSVSCPVTFDAPVEPHEIAAKLHKVLWAEADGELVWHVTDEHLDLVPSDPVSVSYRGQQWRARVVEIEADPGQLKLRMVVDRQGAYSASVSQVPIPPPPTPPQPSIPAETILAVMDIPALTDNGDMLSYYAGMSGVNDNWTGSALQQSLDGGDSFGTVTTTGLNAIMGVLLEPVRDAAPYYTDTTNAVVVQLYTADELDSRSMEAFLSQGGAFALSWDSSDGRQWELMQFRDAEQIGDKTYRLTYLTRGRKDTSTAGHDAGALFVLLDSSILRVSAQSAWIGTDMLHRAVSNGLTPDGAEIVETQYEGHSQREWPVAQLTLDLVGSTLTATAVPRHRFGTSAHPVRSVNWQGYRWTVTDGANTTTREGIAESETFDVSGWSAPISVSVAQVNRITGPGPSVTEDIE